MRKQNRISEIIQKACSDGKSQMIKTTDPPKLFIDGVEIYRVPIKRIFPLPALGIGWAIGLLSWPLLTRLIKLLF